MKRKLERTITRRLRECAALVFFGAAAFAGAQETLGTADLVKIIEKQNTQLQELSQRLQNLESNQTQIKTAMKETNEAVAEQNKKIEKEDSRLSLGKGIEGLKITGDLRLRYEMRDRTFDQKRTDANDGDRTRLRDRLRLGGVWTNKDEAWEIGVGLATGNARASGGTSDGRSTNSDWGRNGVFDHQELWLDYAYAKHKWDLGGTPASLTVGQQKTPFVNTILTWDGDLRPTGVSAQYGDPQGKDYSGPFATVGAYEVSYLSDGRVISGDPQDGIDDNVWLYAAQAGYKWKGEDSSWLGLFGYQKISDAYRNASSWYANSNDPNNAFGAADTGYGYDIGEFYTEYQTSLSGVTVKPYAHVAYNFGAGGDKSQGTAKDTSLISADSSDNALAWMLGVDLKRGKWSLGYAYLDIGADAVFGPMRDSDFGETAGLVDTDIRGHVLRLGYDLTKNCSLGASYYNLERRKGGSGNDSSGSSFADSAQLVQLDLNYKF